MSDYPALPVAAIDLVPHADPMCLVDQLLAVEDDSARVSACLPVDGLLVRADGTLETVVLAELVAQAYAAFRGYELRVRGLQPRAGYLVAIRQLDVLGRAAAGDALTVAVRTVGVLEGFAVVSGEVLRGTERLAKAKLKVYIPEGDLP